MKQSSAYELERPVSTTGGLLGSAGATGLHEMLAMFRRQRWLIILITVFGTAAAAFVGWSRMPVYTATAEVIIAPQRSDLVDPEARGSSLDYEPREIATQMALTRSADFLREVIETLKLQEDVAFRHELRKPEPSLAGQSEAVWQSLVQSLPEAWMVDRGLADEERARPAEAQANAVWSLEAMKRISEHLHLRHASDSFTVYFSFKATDPDLSARIANGIAEGFVRERRDVKLQAMQQGADWLAQQVDHLRDELLEAEEAVERFRTENDLGAEGDSAAEVQLSDLNLKLIAVRTELADKEARLKQLREMQTGGEDMKTMMQIASSPELDELRRREAEISREEADLRTEYGPRHPRWLAFKAERIRVRERLSEAIDGIIRGLEAETRILTTRELALASRRGELEQQAADSRQKAVHLRELERAAAASRAQYLSMLQRYRGMREQKGIVESDARLVAQAPVPDTPSNGGPLHFAAAGFTASCMIAGLVALLRERLDRAFRTPAQVAQVLSGLPTLGVIPQKSGQKNLRRHVLQQPQSDYVEAIRSMHAKLRTLGIDEKPSRVVLITSAVPDEGKTTLAASLAISAASWSDRVILLDLDLRRPRVHRVLEEERTSGLVETLADGKPLKEAIRRHEATGIAYLPVHSKPVNPTALLGSRTMRSAIASLREDYNLIIVDSPPVLAAADATVICGMADQVILAIRWGKTDRAAVAEAVERLHQARANLTGVALTCAYMRKYAQFDYYGYGKYNKKYREYHA